MNLEAVRYKSDINSRLSEMINLCSVPGSARSFPNKLKNEVKLASTDLQVSKPTNRVIISRDVLSTSLPNGNNINQLMQTEKKRMSPAMDALQIYYGGKGSVGSNVNPKKSIPEDKPQAVTTTSSQMPSLTTEPQIIKGILVDATKQGTKPKLLKRVSFESTGVENVENKSEISLLVKPVAKASPKFGLPIKQPTRPSLSDQLAAIADTASQITAGIKASSSGQHAFAGERCDMETALTSFPVRSFSIGTLTCRSPNTAIFYHDRMEYSFSHPFQPALIQLVLYYRDLDAVLLLASPSPGRLQFRVPRRLVHFATDYDPTRHNIVVQFSSSMSFSSVKACIIPLLRK